MATPQRTFSIVLLTTLTLLAAACGGDSNPTPIVICEGPDCEDAGDQTDTEEPDAGDETDTGAPELLCTDTCGSAGDGECDDGGPNSLYDVCALGTDCSDCGPRDPDATCTTHSPSQVASHATIDPSSGIPSSPPSSNSTSGWTSEHASALPTPTLHTALAAIRPATRYRTIL